MSLFCRIKSLRQRKKIFKSLGGFLQNGIYHGDCSAKAFWLKEHTENELFCFHRLATSVTATRDPLSATA